MLRRRLLVGGLVLAVVILVLAWVTDLPGYVSRYGWQGWFRSIFAPV